MIVRLCVRYGVFGLLLCLPIAPAWADEPVDDVMMEVVEDPDMDEREYVDEIRLPDSASPTAREASEFGLDTANEARRRGAEHGREFGQSTAQEARELGRDAGNAARAADGVGGGPPENLPVQVP